MINVIEEMGRYKLINIQELMEKNSEIPEDMKKSIEMYNKAIGDAKNNNIDMAIIALKKAISLNPTFYEAMNFKGLCYLAINNKEKAIETFNTIINSEKACIQALNYKKQVTEDDNDSSQARQENGAFSKWINKGLRPENNTPFILKYVAGFLLGIILFATIWMIVPTGKSLFTVNKSIAPAQDNVEYEQKNIELNDKVEELNQIVFAKEEEINNLNKEFTDYKNQITFINNMKELISKEDYITAYNKMINIKTEELDSSLVEEYNSIYNKILPYVARSLYIEAAGIYNNRTSDDPACAKALEMFETILSFDIELDYKVELYYLAGKAASRSGDNTRAIELFNMIIDEYPGSSYSSYSKNRINEINSGQPITGK